jgi:hypothetical protein
MTWRPPSLPRDTVTKDIHSLFMPLGHYPDRLDEGVYHSWSCLCDDCLREDYALCQYYPGGALTMESWRKMYYKGGN